MRRERILEFNKAFNLPIAEKPTTIPQERWELRIKLLREELDEYEAACKNGDVIEIADALGDLDYLVQGGAVEHGIKLDPVFKEIHDSNMSKLEKGKPIYRNDGKVMKGKNYFKPNIESALGHSYHLSEEEYIHHYIQTAVSVVCDHFGLDVESDIFKKTRVKEICEPRKIIYWLVRNRFTHYQKYGKILQGYFSFDRTTVLNNSTSISNIISVDSEYRDMIFKLKSRIK